MQLSSFVREVSHRLRDMRSRQGWWSVIVRLPRLVWDGHHFLRDLRLVAASGLFDEDWYLQQNQDVAGAGVNPLQDYLRRGAREGRDPNPHFDSDWYWHRYPDVAKAGVNPLVHYLRRGAREGRDPNPHFDSKTYLERNPEAARAGINPLVHYLQGDAAEQLNKTVQPEQNGQPVSVADVLRLRFAALQALAVFHVPGLERRITMVTDSINQGSLFGGVATAIIFSTLLAKKRNARLRIITRTEKADERNFRSILEPNGIEWQNNVEFVYAPVEDDSIMVDVGEQDLFVTTSWWTTYQVKQVISELRIIYLLQEDERMFYPVGDDYLRCSETLASSKMKFVINSKLLYDHLTRQGFDNLRENGHWFEPSFSKMHFYYEARPENKKKNFLFYARPNNLRNLYYRGLEVITHAVNTGILDTNEWELHLIGKDLTAFSLVGGYRPQIIQHLEWSQYAPFLRQIDVGLCLMYTPHPSYPPLDLAACGAVVVTNRDGLKQSLHGYSQNILCRDTDVDSLVAGIADAIALANDSRIRMENYRKNALLTDWNVSFSRVLNRLS